uniref:Uncharacterized protein n=1 Tax=Rhizophora mucronata TaxID=61149 RepID=A0A2P2PLP0_RHIMU
MCNLCYNSLLRLSLGFQKHVICRANYYFLSSIPLVCINFFFFFPNILHIKIESTHVGSLP